MVPMAEFQRRRQRVFEQMTDNSIAVFAAAPVVHRNSDTEYPFRQESYFYYLTGFEESFAIAVLVKKDGQQRYVLFCQERDPEAERWTGSRVGIQGACQDYLADEAYSISETTLRLPNVFSGINCVYYLVNSNPGLDKKLFSWIDTLRKKSRQGVKAPSKYIDLRAIVDDLRLIKTPEEIKLMRKVCAISASAHVKAMHHARVGMNESELEGLILYEFMQQGCRNVAYSSIVASGNNACTLHYTRNNTIIEKDALVLIDAGAELENYAADITRTFPVSGKFTLQQQAIYELVLAAQKAAIALIKPGLAFEDLQKTIVNVIVAGLVELKILKGDINTLVEEKAYLPFYMHNSSHWLGLDVHDVGDYKVDNQSRRLAQGMVFTVEPGLYLDANDTHIPEQWRGIGVRIEDDVLVNTVGCEVLTADAPKTVHDIETLMAYRRD